MKKKYLILIFLLIFSFFPCQINKINTQNIICGKISQVWGNCFGSYIIATCEGEHFTFYGDIASSYVNQMVMIVNPKWKEICTTCGTLPPPYNATEPQTCGWVIIGWDSISWINSCADCGAPPSCEEWLIIKCNVGGYKLYIDGEYILTEDGDGECGIQLPSGTYSIKLKKEGCNIVSETARIECGYSTTLRVTMECDPCEGVICDSRCYGCDYWATKCVDGDCVKDYLIERNSKECGCGDPCEDVRCYPECYGCELWATECVDGDCVKDYLIERDSEECGSECNLCKSDSDGDGINDCIDECINTPSQIP